MELGASGFATGSITGSSGSGTSTSTSTSGSITGSSWGRWGLSVHGLLIDELPDNGVLAAVPS